MISWLVLNPLLHTFSLFINAFPFFSTEVQYPEKDQNTVQKVFDLKDQTSKLSCNTHQQVNLDTGYRYIYTVILNHFLFPFYFVFRWHIFQVAYRRHFREKQVGLFNGTAINELICKVVLLLPLAQERQISTLFRAFRHIRLSVAGMFPNHTESWQKDLNNSQHYCLKLKINGVL